MCSQSWERLGQRPCQDDSLRLEVEGAMEGGPPFKALLCWTKDQVSLWIDENSRRRGSLGIKFIFCIQHTGSPAGCVLGFVNLSCVCAELCMGACQLRQGQGWIKMSDSRNIYECVYCVFVIIVLYKYDLNYIEFQHSLYFFFLIIQLLLGLYLHYCPVSCLACCLYWSEFSS